MNECTIDQLHAFIVEAKSAGYIGSGVPCASHRPKSHDLEYARGEFSYLDSYYGGMDFLGEEVVYFRGEAVWAENYYGRIITPELITGEQVGRILKNALSKMYKEGRFLGGYKHSEDGLTYVDTSEGELTHFSGKEWIEQNSQPVYELLYHGGMIHS
jgi:hypothetical protein